MCNGNETQLSECSIDVGDLCIVRKKAAKVIGYARRRLSSQKTFPHLWSHKYHSFTNLRFMGTLEVPDIHLKSLGLLTLAQNCLRISFISCQRLCSIKFTLGCLTPSEARGYWTLDWLLWQRNVLDCYYVSLNPDYSLIKYTVHPTQTDIHQNFRSFILEMYQCHHCL